MLIKNLKIMSFIAEYGCRTLMNFLLIIYAAEISQACFTNKSSLNSGNIKALDPDLSGCELALQKY